MRLFKSLALTLFAVLSLSSFALRVEGVPAPYSALFESLPLNGVLKVKNFGGYFRAVLIQDTPEGRKFVEVVSGSLLDFYRKLYTLAGFEVKTASLSVFNKGKKLPFNPFYQVWDTSGRVKILTFTNLKPSCKPPVLRLDAQGVRGAKVIVPFERVKKVFFEGGFKYPSYYCY